MNLQRRKLVYYTLWTHFNASVKYRQESYGFQLFTIMWRDNEKMLKTTCK